MHACTHAEDLQSIKSRHIAHLTVSSWQMASKRFSYPGFPTLYMSALKLPRG
jgi:hypothetical protein